MQRSFLFAALALAACDTTGAPADRGLTVDLLGAFDDTAVTVQVDGRTVFRGRATTGRTVASAGAVDVPVAAGEHRVRATVEGRATATLLVSTDTTVAVGVLYTPETDTVSLRAFPHPIVHR